MQRTIKFRALAVVNDKYNSIKVGDFVYGSFIQSGVDAPCIIFGDGEQIEIDKETLGQLTGLTDKNGVDIYENDVVKILLTDWPSQSPEGTLSIDEYKDSLTKVFTIAFNEGAFQISCPCYYSDDLTVYDDIRCGTHGYIEVIGNIHQHPELLQVKGENK